MEVEEIDELSTFGSPLVLWLPSHGPYPIVDLVIMRDLRDHRLHGAVMSWREGRGVDDAPDRVEMAALTNLAATLHSRYGRDYLREWLDLEIGSLHAGPRGEIYRDLGVQA